MADQVNPTGSLAPGLPSQIVAAAAPRPAPEPSRSANAASSKAQGQGRQTVPELPAVSVAEKAPEAAMEQFNAHLEKAGSQLKFQSDQATGRTVFKVVNPNTGEVLLQVPSEEMLAMARNLRAMEKHAGASGVLVDKEG